MTITPQFQTAYDLQMQANRMFEDVGRISEELANELEKAFDLLTFDEVIYLHEIAIPNESKEEFDHAFNNKD
jgi:hypothetical protein